MAGSSHTDLVNSIYDAALDPASWQFVLKQIGRYVGAKRAVVGYSDIHSELANVFEMRRVENLISSEIWINDYDMHDPWSHTGEGLTVGDVRTGCQLLPIQRFRNLPVYKDVFKKVRIEDCLVGFTAKSGSCLSYLAFYRGPNENLFGRTAVEKFSSLMPHLIRAAKIHAKITDLEAENSAHRTTLELLPVAALLCDKNAKILAFNHLADELLRKNDGVIARQNYLRATHIEDDSKITGAIAKASLTALCKSAQGGDLFSVRRRDAQRPLYFIVSPVSEFQGERHFLPGITTPSAIVFISDPSCEFNPPTDRLTKLFGLSQAEGRLVMAICTGQSLKEFADHNSISIHTAQSQIKNAFKKTGTHRQSELVSLVMTSIANWGQS